MFVYRLQLHAMFHVYGIHFISKGVYINILQPRKYIPSKA